MKFNENSNIQMVWRMIIKMTDKKYKINLSVIPDMNTFFSDKVRILERIGGRMSVMDKNKRLIQDCHEYIQNFITHSARDSRLSKRKDEIHDRMMSAQQDMNVLLDGNKPVPLDFSDKKELMWLKFDDYVGFRDFLSVQLHCPTSL